MARPLDREKRAQMLSAVVDVMNGRGIADLSLRTIAAELGTTSRMLVHYFGSKEELLTQALATQHPSLTADFDSVGDIDGLRAALTALWATMTGSNATARSTLILLQAMGIAVVQPGPYADYATRAIHDLVSAVGAAFVRAGANPDAASDLATAAVSGLRGSLVDRLITHDHDRTDRAAHRLIELVADKRAVDGKLQVSGPESSS